MATKDSGLLGRGKRFITSQQFIDWGGARGFGILLGLLGWMGIAMVFPNRLMPFPLETLSLTWDLIRTGTAFPNLIATMWRTLWGLLGAMIIGTSFGILMGINGYGEQFFKPYVIIGLSIPAIAWAAVTTLIFGFNLLAPVGATILTTFPYIAINVWKGVETIEADIITMSQSFNVSRLRILYRLIIPSTAPFLFSAFRFGLSISWKVVTIAEIFAASNGIGYQLVQAYTTYQFGQAWAWAILFIIVILVIEYGFVKPLEHRVFEYRKDADFTLLG